MVNGDVMSAEAIGAYFRVLRENRGISQEALASLINLKSSKQVYNLERGTSIPRGDTLIGLLTELGGSISHLRLLFNDESATESYGRELAYRWLSKEDIDELDSIPPSQRITALSILDDLEKKDRTTFDAAIHLLKSLVGKT